VYAYIFVPGGHWIGSDDEKDGSKRGKEKAKEILVDVTIQ
jgi:hypothetical protein